MLTIKAYAKINLALDILSRRKDSYHEVSMIMQSVSLADVLRFEKTDLSGADISITGAYHLTGGNDNLIAKAADRFFKACQINAGIRVCLEKNIPVAAGLAGGSADAAATLFACNTLYGEPLSTDKLYEIGKSIGADVPFCMTGGLAHAFGIGEKLTPLPTLPICYMCIAVPDVSVSTPYIYGQYDKMYQDNGFVAYPIARPDITAMVSCIQSNLTISKIVPFMNNVLEALTVRECPAMIKIEEVMCNYGAIKAQMSGSGPSVFGFFSNRKKAEIAAKKITETDHTIRTFVCKNINKGLQVFQE